MFAYKIAGLAELVLVLVEHSGWIHPFRLPIGGGQLQQIGMIFAAAHVVAESSDLLKSFAFKMATVVRRPRKVGRRPNKEGVRAPITKQ